MFEVAVPALVDVPHGRNLTDIVVDNATEVPDAVVLAKRPGADWVDVTAAEFRREVETVAKGLVAAGVEPGDRVALMSRTRYEWTLVDFAIWFAGAVTVPIYETSSAEQVEWILTDSGAVVAIVEAPHHHRLVESVRGAAGQLREVLTIDDGAISALSDRGSAVPDSTIEERRRGLDCDALATVIYTSGTTGRPKGCELTHGNFLHELGEDVALMPQVFAPGASTLLFLPLAHVFARIIQIGALMARAKLGHAPDIKNLTADFASFRPTFVLAVPRVFEKIYNSANQKAQAEGKGRIFQLAASTAISYSEALDKRGPNIVLRLEHALFDRLVYGKLRAAMGGRAEYAISGGAPLGARLGHFFRGIGLKVVEGYGLTETTAAATTASPDQVRIGTVGRPLPGSSLAIADDGEVLIKGPHVFRGYWHNAAATADVLDGDGWFHSGDIGELDADGYLTITGRKKELLVTAGGKNVAPAVLEDRLRSHALISQCMVVGDGQPFIAALVTLDTEILPGWLETHKLPAMSVADAAGNEQVRAEVQRAVDDANQAVSRAEAIRRFAILDIDFTEEGGQLTPSLKLKRSVVLKEFAAEVEALYS